MTDHLIRRRPPAGDLLGDKTEAHETPATAYRGEVVLYDPAQPAAAAESALYLLGALLATRGDNEGALRELELETAVQLEPDFGRAQFELAVVLGRQGDSDAAAEHLRLAAQSGDPEAEAQAQQLLQKLAKRF